MANETKTLMMLDNDSQWVTENYDKLRKYEGKVIAVKNQEIIEVSDTLEHLLRKLEERKENSAFLLIEAIPPKGVSFIL
jgi:hypothetical protein